MGRRNLSFLILIAVVGAVLRFVYLTWNPPSLNWDEVSHGYNAYSVLRTGADQWGQKFPVFNFRAYGDYPTTLNLYLTVPFVALFGLTDMAIRFPHALLGTFAIIAVYFFAYGITKKVNVGLFSAFLFAIEPWSVFTSRFVLQSNLSVLLLIVSAAFFVNRDRNKLFFPLSIASLFLTLFAYHSTRIFSPIFLLGVMFIFHEEVIVFFRKNKILGILLGFVIFSFFVLVGIILSDPKARARGNVLFIIDQGAINKIDSERNTSHLPLVVRNLIYNRPTYFFIQFSKNYLSYFSPKFLFLDGGTQYQFSIPGHGIINPVEMPFFYIGLVIVLFKCIKNKNFRLVLLWTMLSPIPASLTNESYTVVRATTMLPIPELLSSISIFWLMERINKKYYFVLSFIFFATLYLFLESYFINYFTNYRTNYSWSWQYGYKEVVDYVANNYGKYNQIIVTKKYGEPHEYFLFFLKYDPLKYQSDKSKITFFQSDWWWVDHFDKFWFVNDWQIPKAGSTFITESRVKVDCRILRCLLVSSPGNAPSGWHKIYVVNFLDGKVGFELYENR